MSNHTCILITLFHENHTLLQHTCTHPRTCVHGRVHTHYQAYLEKNCLLKGYLNSCLWEIYFVGKAFSGKHIWIVSPFKFYNKDKLCHY